MQMLVEQSGTIPLAAQRAILQQELTMWRNTRYQYDVRLRVHRRIGDGDEVIAGIIKELERCEKALDVLNEELAALEVPTAS